MFGCRSVDANAIALALAPALARVHAPAFALAPTPASVLAPGLAWLCIGFDRAHARVDRTLVRQADTDSNRKSKMHTLHKL